MTDLSIAAKDTTQLIDPNTPTYLRFVPDDPADKPALVEFLGNMPTGGWWQFPTKEIARADFHLEIGVDTGKPSERPYRVSYEIVRFPDIDPTGLVDRAVARTVRQWHDTYSITGLHTRPDELYAFRLEHDAAGPLAFRRGMRMIWPVGVTYELKEKR